MKNNLFSGILALAFSAAVSNVSASNELVKNGGFEDGATGWNLSGIMTIAPGNVYAHYGWTDNGYTDGNVALFGNGTIVNGKNNGVLTQNLNTVAGQNYKLIFGYGAVVGIGQEQDIDVSIINGSNTLSNERFITHGQKYLANLMTTHEMVFTAQSMETTIQFRDPNIANGDTVDGAIDNVSVSAVPEPEA